jgi:hypothetical protein
MDAAGSERAVILGESDGGLSAMFFAATYPEPTAGLSLGAPLRAGRPTTTIRGLPAPSWLRRTWTPWSRTGASRSGSSCSSRRWPATSSFDRGGVVTCEPPPAPRLHAPTRRCRSRPTSARSCRASMSRRWSCIAPTTCWPTSGAPGTSPRPSRTRAFSSFPATTTCSWPTTTACSPPSRSSSRANRRGRDRIGCSPRRCSSTSSSRQTAPWSSATAAGATSSSRITRSYAASSTVSKGRRSTPRGTPVRRVRRTGRAVGCACAI